MSLHVQAAAKPSCVWMHLWSSHCCVVCRQVCGRYIDRVITPGTYLNLTNRDAKFLLAIVGQNEDDELGLAWADISTGEFLVCSIN